MEKQEKKIGQNYKNNIETKNLVRITKPDRQEIQSTLLLKAQPMSLESKEVSEKALGSNEKRRLCETPDQYPFSAIGVLYVSFSNFVAFGTGFLIQSNILLTAAHNIYNRESRQAANSAKLVMEFHGNKKTFQAVCAYFPKQYKQKKIPKGAREFDYAIVILENMNIISAQKYQTIPLSCEMNQDDQVEIYGYPRDLSKDQFREDEKKYYKGESTKMPKQKSLFGCKGQLKELGQRVILHLVPTSSGQSGSPVLRFNKQYNRYEAIGVHTNSMIRQNGAVRIINGVLDQISKWIQDFWNRNYNDQKVMLIDNKGFQIIKGGGFEQKINKKRKVKLTPDKQSRGFKQKNWVIDNINTNVCIANINGYSNWLCSSPLPFDGDFVFTIKVIQLTNNILNLWSRNIFIGVMENEKKGDEYGDTYNHSVYLYLQSQRIYRPNEEQTGWHYIGCSCSSLPQCPFQIECHVNRQQNTIEWHYAGKWQTKSTMPKAWKANQKQLCAIFRFYQKGDRLEMM